MRYSSPDEYSRIFGFPVRSYSPAIGKLLFSLSKTHVAWKPLMKHLIAIVLLVALLSGSSALTSGEENALKALLHSFPALADAAPAWSSNTSAACDLLPFYGVTCSDGPEKHITRLYVGGCFQPKFHLPICAPHDSLSCPHRLTLCDIAVSIVTSTSLNSMEAYLKKLESFYG